jgi:hypothetical protein
VYNVVDKLGGGVCRETILLFPLMCVVKRGRGGLKFSAGESGSSEYLSFDKLRAGRTRRGKWVLQVQWVVQNDVLTIKSPLASVDIGKTGKSCVAGPLVTFPSASKVEP